MHNMTKLEKLEAEIKILENKEFTTYFYVMDSKGTPSGHLTYIYQMAHKLNKMGYKVAMLHQSENFDVVESVGVWLGMEYTEIPHLNVEKNEIVVAPSDFIIIPEMFTNVMKQTSSLPCKRIVLANNINYVTEFIPLGESWVDYGLLDVITTSTKKAELLKSYFPSMNMGIIRPYVDSNLYQNKTKNKKMLVNIVTKEQPDVNRIIKPFYWQYPSYSWVSFRELRGLSKAELAESLDEAAVTIWLDDYASFGYTAIEAMKCGSIVIGKIPEEMPEWMGDGRGLKDNGIWFNHIDDIPKLIVSVVNAWINNSVPSELIEAVETSKAYFTEEQHVLDIQTVYIDKILENRKKEFKRMSNILKNKSE